MLLIFALIEILEKNTNLGFSIEFRSKIQRDQDLCRDRKKTKRDRSLKRVRVVNLKLVQKLSKDQ